MYLNEQWSRKKITRVHTLFLFMSLYTATAAEDKKVFEINMS